MNNSLLPNTIVIGASKCGTTALYEYLKLHPDIFLSEKKELHFHSRDEVRRRIAGPGDKYLAGQICFSETDYKNYYAKEPEKTVRVEVSPSYLFFTSSVDSIIKYCGLDVKIICFVKHPVDKITSQYSHLYSAGRESLTFEQALKEEDSRDAAGYGDMWLYRRSGFMSENAAFFKEKFNNVLILHQDDLLTNLKGTLDRIFEFIGVAILEEFNYEPIRKNFSGLPKSRLISKIFIRPNFFTHFLRKIINPKLGGKIREWINNNNKGNKFTLPDAHYKRLEHEYTHEIDELNKLIDSEIKIKKRFND